MGSTESALGGGVCGFIPAASAGADSTEQKSPLKNFPADHIKKILR